MKQNSCAACIHRKSLQGYEPGRCSFYFIALKRLKICIALFPISGDTKARTPDLRQAELVTSILNKDIIKWFYLFLLHGILLYVNSNTLSPEQELKGINVHQNCNIC